MLCVVERTASTMMQRMSDMLTRWLEGAMRRAENETEGDESQDQLDSDDHDAPPLSAPTDSSLAVEQRVEASLQDVANLRLSPPSPTDDADLCAASEAVDDVLCSASCDVDVTVAVSDAEAVMRPPTLTDSMRPPTLTDSLSTASHILADGSDSEPIVDVEPVSHSTDKLKSESHNLLTSTLPAKPHSDSVSTDRCSASTTAVVADSSELNDRPCSVAVSVSPELQNHCEEETVDMEENIDTCHVEKNPASQS